MSKPMAVSAGAVCDAFAEELATVLGALLGVQGAATASLAAPEASWHVSIGVAGAATGVLTVGIAGADAARLAGLVLGLEETPSDEAVRDMLQEVCGQAAGALSQRPLGLTFTVVQSGAFDRVPPRGVASSFQVSLGDAGAPRLACWCDLDELATLGSLPDAPNPVRGAPTLDPEANAARREPITGTAYPPNLEVILDIELPMSVRFGETEMTLDALTRLGPGSVIDLGRSPDDLVDVLVNGRLVARGEVVVASGNYAVRVTEVVSTSDRLRSMGGLRTRATDRL
jgi:flagellar motor switch protein FliN